MAVSLLKRNAFLSRFKPLLSSQRWFNHGLVEGGPGAKYRSNSDEDSRFQSGISKTSNWKRMDSRSLGIRRSMISLPSLIVLEALKSKGHEAYLVGGCVRDLLLKKTPKDFDVITTAGLKQIRKQFHRAVIVGQKFPICRVHVRGSVIEVSSFQTVASHDKNRQRVLDSQTPKGCDYSDFIRWKNSTHRDFTINSLFFDPFLHKIYDYANGMKDLLDLKLRTLLPAQLSFKEDPARILRGLRIAARLGLSLSDEIETAINEHSSTISRLNKARINMELNYMLSYGAAEPSLRLLQRFHLLDLFLPFHGACLSQQATRPGPMMLLRLFFHLDQLVACDRPSDSSLWIGLLAFHLALVKNPQHPLVVCTFASVLYHGKWKDNVELTKQYSQAPAIFVPETSQTRVNSDDELVARVKNFALHVKDSLNVFIEENTLRKVMNIFFPNYPCSDLVFVSRFKGNKVCHLFDGPLCDDLKSEGRKHFEINYDLLGEGDVEETRFAMGKIIMDTMSCGVYQGGRTEINNNDRKHDASDSTIQQDGARQQKLMRNTSITSEQGTAAKQNKNHKRKLEKLVGVCRNLVEKAYDSISHDDATNKGDDVMISLIEKNKGQMVAKENKEVVNKSCANVCEEQNQVATSQSHCEQVIRMLKTKVNSENEEHLKTNESFKETLIDLGEFFPVNEVARENATKKLVEVTISLTEKKNGQKVAKTKKKKKQVVGKACANVSKEQEKVAASQSPSERVIGALKTKVKYVSKRHSKRNETPLDLGEEKVAKENKEVVNKACAHNGEEQATSQSQCEQVIRKLKTKVTAENEKHLKRNESFKETLIDLGECFPENEVACANATKTRDEVTISLIEKNGQKISIEKKNNNKNKKQLVGNVSEEQEKVAASQSPSERVIGTLKTKVNYVSEKHLKRNEAPLDLGEQEVAKENKEVVNKACAHNGEEQATSQSQCEKVTRKLKTKVPTENVKHLKRNESLKETLVDLGECFPANEVARENATKKRDEVTISLIEKKNGQKVAMEKKKKKKKKEKKQLVGKACANVSEEQEKVAASQSPSEQVIGMLKTKVKYMSEKHLKRNETPLDVGECFPENEASPKQQKSVETYDPPQGKKVRTEESCANPPPAIVNDKKKHNNQIIKEMDRKLKLSDLFK